MMDLFERHDRSRFEIHGVSFGPDEDREWRARLSKAFDHFHDIPALGDAEAANFLRGLEFDIAMDLKGYTELARPDIFLRRVAPVQVNSRLSRDHGVGQRTLSWPMPSSCRGQSKITMTRKSCTCRIAIR